jgi:hypothetical protein
MNVLLLIGFWVLLDILLCRALLSVIKNSLIRFPLVFVVFSLILVLPFLDELVGGLEFNSLCRKENERFSEIQIDSEGRDVFYSRLSLNGAVVTKALDISFVEHIYVEVESRREVFRYKTFLVRGGIVQRFISAGTATTPLLIGESSCSPIAAEKLIKKFRSITPN